ncbi:hypothetical protein ABH926_007306 [Catenulispora sp. GP43]|uniref:hypothetical protein n=1 Tax=Catenulispora sp. GP43 TaxID=3156263 RepID=UPI003517020B
MANSRINALSADGARDVWLVGDNDPAADSPILTEIPAGHINGSVGRGAWRVTASSAPLRPKLIT